MRKLTIELKINDNLANIFDFLLEKIDSMELIELLRVDFEKGEKLAIASIHMKQGYAFEDIQFPEFVDIISIVKKEGNTYVCLVKAKFLKQFINLASKFNIDIVWDTPSIFTKEKMIMSVIGDEKNLKKFLETIKLIGVIQKISFQKAMISEHSILSCLTAKQKEILIQAKKNGYYEYPRKITSQQLSKQVGLSKPTVVQHLRKAEKRIITNILAGY